MFKKHSEWRQCAAPSYLLVVSDLFVDLRLDHSFGDGPGNRGTRSRHGQADAEAVSDDGERLVLHGFGGEVLAEVSHDVERVVRGSGEDASGRLETQVCDRRKSKVFT